MVSPRKGRGRRDTQPTCVCTVFVALVSYWCVLGNTGRVSPNYQGSHQIPSCTADRRGGILISFGPNYRPLEVLNPSKGSGSGTEARDLRPLYRSISFERPRPHKGIGLRVPSASTLTRVRSQLRLRGDTGINSSGRRCSVRRFHGGRLHIPHGHSGVDRRFGRVLRTPTADRKRPLGDHRSTTERPMTADSRRSVGRRRPRRNGSHCGRETGRRDA